MQAILMAAGKGTRLGSMTAEIPKSFVEIQGKKLIEINVNMLKKHGIHEIVIVTGCHAEKFEELFGEDPEIKLVYNPFYGFTNVIGSFFMGMPSLREDFVYLHADTICDPSILEEMLETEGDILLPVDTRPCDEEAMKVVSVEGKIRRIGKELDPQMCDGEFIGIAKLRAKVLPKLKRAVTELLRQEAFGEYFEAAIQQLLDEDEFDVKMVDTRQRFWAEIDFLEDYQRAMREVQPCLLKFI